MSLVDFLPLNSHLLHHFDRVFLHIHNLCLVPLVCPELGEILLHTHLFELLKSWFYSSKSFFPAVHELSDIAVVLTESFSLHVVHFKITSGVRIESKSCLISDTVEAILHELEFPVVRNIIRGLLENKDVIGFLSDLA